jgi:hypothetical protein
MAQEMRSLDYPNQTEDDARCERDGEPDAHGPVISEAPLGECQGAQRKATRIARGTIAVHRSRLVIVSVVKPGGKVAVRDLASGGTRDVAIGELSARTIRLARPMPSGPMPGWSRRTRRCIEPHSSARSWSFAALVREGPVRLAAAETSAVNSHERQQALLAGQSAVAIEWLSSPGPCRSCSLH